MLVRWLRGRSLSYLRLEPVRHTRPARIEVPDEGADNVLRVVLLYWLAATNAVHSDLLSRLRLLRRA
jgi:hypothetical protein